MWVTDSDPSLPSPPPPHHHDPPLPQVSRFIVLRRHMHLCIFPLFCFVFTVCREGEEPKIQSQIKALRPGAICYHCLLSGGPESTLWLNTVCSKKKSLSPSGWVFLFCFFFFSSFFFFHRLYSGEETSSKRCDAFVEHKGAVVTAHRLFCLCCRRSGSSSLEWLVCDPLRCLPDLFYQLSCKQQSTITLTAFFYDLLCFFLLFDM